MPLTGHLPADPELRDLRAQVDALTSLGPAARHTLIALADRGDWRTRVLATSALGVLVRRESADHTLAARTLRVLAGIPGLRRHVPSMGGRGRLVSRTVTHLTADRSFIVRTAAALALGECRDDTLASSLVPLLADPFLPVRRAAAAALVACEHAAPPPATLTEGCETTPLQMAEGVDTLPWLQWLATAHQPVLDAASRSLDAPAPPAPERYASWLAGALQRSGDGGAPAEAARYDAESDLAYQLEKPFGSHDRAENLRQLDAFVALAAHLDLPRGARVLDLGGGSGWVGELLARVGFEPVIVDVAHPLLQLARQRLTANGLPGRVVAGDVTALPLRTGSVDAVIAMDALHHIQNLAGVMAEARRVLADGGLFLIAEPGEGHAESPKSLAEAHEHGVRESEISPFVIDSLARSAGFDRVALLPRLPAQATLDVAGLRSAMARPADEWPVYHLGSETRFATLALRSMLARPLLVLGAGRRPLDTRAPGVLLAEIQPAVRRTGDRVHGTLMLRNAGDTTWLATAEDGVGVVWVGAQRLARDGRMLDRECWRTRLSAVVPPGATRQVAIELLLPPGTDECRLKFDLVAERVCWFEDRGSRPAHVDV